MSVEDLQARRKAAASTAPTAAPAAAAPPPRRRRHLVIVIVLVAATAAAVGIGGWILRPTPVDVAPVTRGEAVDAIYASGVVEYVRQARIAPVVTAPIRQVLAAEGETVRPGQALAQLDDGPQMGTTLQLEAQAALVRGQARRTDRLFQAGFAARAARDDVLQQLAAAEAAARSARSRLADYRIVAPFAGEVLRRDAEPGDLATVGVPLFVIADRAALRVTADVDERDVGRLAQGQQAVLRADTFPGRTFPATVTSITPQGNSTGRVFRARLSLDPATALRPGMTVEANLVVARRTNAVLVPTTAIRGGFVWTVDGDHANRQAVTLGAQGAAAAEILRGVAPGTRVVLNPPAAWKDSARIKVRAGR
jgi:RND family efflux transporter MFP subunit